MSVTGLCIFRWKYGMHERSMGIHLDKNPIAAQVEISIIIAAVIKQMLFSFFEGCFLFIFFKDSKLGPFSSNLCVILTRKLHLRYLPHSTSQVYA